MNIEAFILAEISNFEKIKNKFEEQKNKVSFSEKVNRIIEENGSKIAKYPENQFHPEADPEITRLYGAVSEFAQYYFRVLRLLDMSHEDKNHLYEIETGLDEVSSADGKAHSKKIKDHILLLSLPDIPLIDIERNRNEYLKECSFILHSAGRFCENLIINKNPFYETPLSFEKKFTEPENINYIKKIFSGNTGYGAILLIKTQAGNIIDDFRIGSFIRGDNR